METDKSRLKLSATNLEIGISCWIPARIDEDGATTVPARLLMDFVNSLPTETVSLELSERGQTLDVTSDRFQAEIKGIDAKDFPILPSVDEGLRFSLDADSLGGMVDQVAFAAATDESRPPLMGVLTVLDPGDQTMTMAAADGFRLSLRRASLDAVVEEKLSVIVPARALLELARIAGGDDDRVWVSITENRNQVLFRHGSVELVSQLLQGPFPDYERVIPSDCATRVVANVKTLQNAVRLASLFARGVANIVRLEVQPGDDLQPGTMAVSANSAEVGQNHSELEASITGPAVEVAFNAKYLLEVLSVIGSDQVAMEFSASSRAALFRPVNDIDYVHVVMPMHTGD